MTKEEIKTCKQFMKKTYMEYVEFLKNKYGLVNDNYMIFTDHNTCYRNPKLGYPHEGLSIHHIKEDTYALLSHPEVAYFLPQSFQNKENLVYCNEKEHTILHYLICKEDKKHNHRLGIGGIVNYGLGFALTKTDKDWNKIYLKIINNLKPLRPDLEDVFSNPEKQIGLKILQDRTERLSNNNYIHEQILINTPVGITLIKKDEYQRQYYNKVGHLKDDDKIYLLHSLNNITAVVIERNAYFYLLNGGKIKKFDISYNNIEEIYQLIEQYYLKCSSLFTPIIQQQKLVSDYIKANKGLGDIHGLIIDVDIVTTRIIFNPINNNYIAYEGNCYNSEVKLLSSPVSAIQKTLSYKDKYQIFIPTLFNPQIHSLLNQENPLQNTITTYTGNTDLSKIHSISKKFYEIQRTLLFKHIGIWNTKILSLIEISSNPLLTLSELED